MEPRELLPPECCWELVFDKVEDPQDWLNLYRASSSYFQEVVGGKRTTALFPQVLGHVTPYLEENLHTILGVRLVCRAWKTAVDAMLEDTNSPGVNIRRQLVDHAYELTRPSRISSFLEWFENHSGKNPFVVRRITLSYDLNRLFADAAARNLLATRLLDKFGAQIKDLHVYVLDNNLDNSGPSRILQGCLRRVPNLDSLRVICTCLSDNDDPVVVGGDIDEEEEEGSSLLLPRPNLSSITFFLPSSEERGSRLKLQNAVVRGSNPNSLKSVSTSGFPPALLHCPNVEVARLTLETAEDYSNLASAPWPSLSALTVFNCLGETHPLSCRLFECVERFKASLSSLTLELPMKPDPSVKLKLVDLPHLKQLTLVKHPPMSLGCLINLTALEDLTIYQEHPFESRREKELQRFVRGVKAEVVLWGLWDGLPQLRKICLIGSGSSGTTRKYVATRSNRGFIEQK